MAKTLITHTNPHLDDIFAIWLFKKFNPEFKDAKLEFISASRDKAGQENADKFFIGTGGGLFDEHKEGLDTCAGSLVYEYLKERGYMPKDMIALKALERLVEWNRLIDTGRAPNSQFDEFSIQSFIRSKGNSAESSGKSVNLGMEILDRIFEVLKRKQQSILDWERRMEFRSRFGKSFALVSETINREFCREKSGDLFLMFNPKDKSVQFFTPIFEIDLKPLFEKLKQLDPKASWFLHQSHHMILCGASSAPQFTSTKLSFDQLIKTAKTI